MAARATLADFAFAFLRAKAAADETQLGQFLRNGQTCLKEQFKQVCTKNSGWDQKEAAKSIPQSAYKKITEWSQRWGAQNNAPCRFSTSLKITAQQYTALSNGSDNEWSASDLSLLAAAKRAHLVFKRAVLKAFNTYTLEKVLSKLSEPIEEYPKIKQLVERWHSEM